MVSVTIVSDIRLFREGLAEIMSRKGSVFVVSTAQSEKQAIAEICNNSPDVVLVDMTMIESNEIIGNITVACPDARIVALSVGEDEKCILACAKAGVVGYVSRDTSIDQLLDAIYGVVEGELYCPRRIAASLIYNLKSTPTNDVQHAVKIDGILESQIAQLTLREKQIVELLSYGFSNKKIARELMIEVSTVKNHVHHILAKLGVTSRVQVVSMLKQQAASKTIFAI